MRRTRRAGVTALFAVVVLVLGQLAGLAHEATTRHVTCAEHGETLEAAALAETLHACNDAHLVAVTGDAGDDHADCSILRALHASSTSVAAYIVPAVLATHTTSERPLVSTASLSRAVYRMAPKTSPPA